MNQRCRPRTSHAVIHDLIGRPILMRELSTKTPAGADYIIKSALGAQETLLRTRTKSFKSCLSALNQTISHD